MLSGCSKTTHLFDSKWTKAPPVQPRWPIYWKKMHHSIFCFISLHVDLMIFLPSSFFSIEKYHRGADQQINRNGKKFLKMCAFMDVCGSLSSNLRPTNVTVWGHNSSNSPCSSTFYALQIIILPIGSLALQTPQKARGFLMGVFGCRMALYFSKV